MNPFLLSPRDRLTDWKTLRNHLSSLSEHEQLVIVAKYWAQAPVAKFAYDIEKPETWLSPWEMISEGDWCAPSRAIGMEFTLRLAGWDASRLNIKLIKDYDECEVLGVVEVDNKLYLNYNEGEVIEIPHTKRDVIASWQNMGKDFREVA